MATTTPAVAPATADAPAPSRPPATKRNQGIAWLFLAPYLVLFGVFVLLPILLGIWISLHSWDFTLPGKPFVGLDNYTALFDPDSLVFERFWNAMQATGIFTLFSVPLLIVVPLGVALVIWVVVLKLSGYVSLASVAAAAGFPLAVYLLDRPDQPGILWLVALVAAAIIWLHRANIRRLLNGTESRFGRRAAPPAHP